MGFLKKVFFVFLLTSLIPACRLSLIRLDVKYDKTPYSLFGGTNERKFFIDQEISLEVKEKWTGSINGSFNNSSVTVFDSYIFVNDLSGRIAVFEINTGKRSGELKEEDAVFTAPVIKDFWVIFASIVKGKNLSHLLFYDYNAGQVKHLTEIKGRVTNQLLLDKDGAILITEDGDLMKYDFAGNSVWITKTNSTVHSNPAMSRGIIVFGTDEGEIIGADKDSGKILYREKIGSPVMGGVTISGIKCYFGNDEGILYCTSLQNGAVDWKYDTKARIIMNPAAGEGNVIVGNLAGDLFKLDAEDGALIWKTETKGSLNASPLVTRNIILVPDLFERLHFVDRENGEILKSITVEGRMKLSPVIQKNLLFVGFDRGKMRAYEFVD